MFNPGCTFTSIRNCNKGTQLGCQQFEHYKMFLKKYFRKVPVYALTLTPSCILQQNIVSLSNIGILILCLLGAWLITISMKELGFFWFFFWDFPSHYLFSKLWVTGSYTCLLCYNVVPEEIWLHFASDSVKVTTADVPVWRSRYQQSSEEIQFQGKLRLHIYQN